MPLSRLLALKHTTAPQFSGKKPEFTACTRDASYYGKTSVKQRTITTCWRQIPVRAMKLRKTSLGTTLAYARHIVNQAQSPRWEVVEYGMPKRRT